MTATAQLNAKANDFCRLTASSKFPQLKEEDLSLREGSEDKSTISFFMLYGSEYEPTALMIPIFFDFRLLTSFHGVVKRRSSAGVD